MRCFVAIDLSTDVRAAIARAETRVRTAARHADVRWVDPAQFHLTLKFLGAVPDERLPAVSATLEGAVADTAPIALAAAGLGGFPSLRSARVLWAGITAGVPELARLAAFGSWTASEVVLYESRLKPTGAVYTAVSRHPLRGARA